MRLISILLLASLLAGSPSVAAGPCTIVHCFQVWSEGSCPEGAGSEGIEVVIPLFVLEGENECTNAGPTSRHVFVGLVAIYVVSATRGDEGQLYAGSFAGAVVWHDWNGRCEVLVVGLTGILARAPCPNGSPPPRTPYVGWGEVASVLP